MVESLAGDSTLLMVEESEEGSLPEKTFQAVTLRKK